MSSSSSSSSSSNKRRDTEMLNLMMAGYNVEMINESIHKFHVTLDGPADSPYVGGVWKLKVELPDDYPFSSPSIRFINKMYHPNVDFMTGAICLNVLNEEWSAMSDLVTMFNIYLPQLLKYPNPQSPFNIDAAHLFSNNKPAYEAKLREYIDQYAKPEDDDDDPAEDEPSEDSEEVESLDP